MMLIPPSITTDYSMMYSGDPALDAPEAPPMDSSPDIVSCYELAKAEWAHRLTVARETGNWGGMIKAGHRPTVFRMRQIPGTIRRRLLDLCGGEMSSRPTEFTSLCFRAAIVGIENLGDEKAKVERAHDPILNASIATSTIVDRLDDIHLGIVGELGEAVLMRAIRPHPKS